MKKFHRVAHEKSEAWWVLLILLYSFRCYCQAFFCKNRQLSGASTLARNKNYYKPQKCGLFYVKFYLFLCCTELYFIFICDIMRYETQL